MIPFNFGPLKTAWGWVCNCLSNPPRPTRTTTNSCSGGFGEGQNANLGISCTEPSSVADVTILPRIYPPKCWDGDGAPCNPMPAAWRVTFSCRVPGSNCIIPHRDLTGTGTGTGSCIARSHLNPITSQYIAPRPPYTSCPGCWDLGDPLTGTGSFILNFSDAFGGVTDACGVSLSQPAVLCYVAASSDSSKLTWGTDCVSSDPILETGTGTGTVNSFCGPEKYDIHRRRWQLEWDVATSYWTLFSFDKIKKPIYRLHDTDPCSGNSKTLTAIVDPSAPSGFHTYPATITIRRRADCSVCTNYTEPGCEVMLVRVCGSSTYALRSHSSVSADPNHDHICGNPTQAGGTHCCTVGTFYTKLVPTDCCTIQKYDYIGRHDPWFNNDQGSYKAWTLDLAAGTLTGNFTEGTVVYTVDTYGISCRSVSVFYQTSNTLPSNLKKYYPNSVCMVADEVLTCNTKLNPGFTGTGTGTYHDTSDIGQINQTWGPRANAGYYNATGDDDFCTCFDSCDPVILGTITGHNCGTVPVCFTRINQKGRDVRAKSAYSRIGCVRLFDGTKFNVLTQVVYCIGAGSWAADWYCTLGTNSTPDPLTDRSCLACAAFEGTFLGTTFASKSSCGGFPFFPAPTPPPTNNCFCVVGVCCNGPVSSGGLVPDTLHCTFSNPFNCACLSGSTSSTITYSGGVWSGTINVPGCGTHAVVTLSCDGSGNWTLTFKAGSGGCGVVSVDRTFTAPAIAVTCSPFSLPITVNDVTTANKCCAGATLSPSFKITFTA